MKKIIIILLYLLSLCLAQDKVPNLRIKMLNGKYAKIHDFIKNGPTIIDFGPPGVSLAKSK